MSLDYLIPIAQAFSHEAHDANEQQRKYTGEPYWTHTDEVATLVGGMARAHPWLICAAHLHDVQEDVGPKNILIPGPERFGLNVEEVATYDIYSIGRIFGAEVSSMVTELTDVYTKEAYPELNRETRKKLERHRLNKISSASKTIKLADIVSNTKRIAEYDPEFAKTYMAEMRDLIPLIEGHPTLYNAALFLVQDYYKWFKFDSNGSLLPL